MMIFEKAKQNADAIRRAGDRAREEARQAGTCIYFIDKARGDGIIREYPDGHQERVENEEKTVHGPIRHAAPGR